MRRSIVLAALALCCSRALAGHPIEAQKAAAVNRETWLALDSAYSQGRASGNLSLLKRELEKLFLSTDDRRRLALNWIGRHRESLTHSEEEELYRVYFGVHPDDETATSLRNTIAANRLADATKGERSALYWTAIRNGKARIPEGDVLPRTVALGMAAADGLEEFRSSLREFAPEIDRVHPRTGYRESDYLITLLAFRAGATNRTDAVNLHTKRLLELTDEEFLERMNSDTAFREVTQNVAVSACKDWQSGECRSLAKLYVRQERYQARREKTDLSTADGQQAPRTPEGEFAWMSNLKGLTGGEAALRHDERKPDEAPQ